MTDHTESLRREMIETNQPHVDLAHAESRMTTAEMSELYTVQGFMAPFVVVTRKSDGVKGSLEFTHSPRLYFNFTPA
jgi:hypothetical protein